MHARNGRGSEQHGMVVSELYLVNFTEICFYSNIILN